MSERLQRALVLRSIIDTELSKPFPRIPEVKHALRMLGPLLHDLAGAIDRTEMATEVLRCQMDAVLTRKMTADLSADLLDCPHA